MTSRDGGMAGSAWSFGNARLARDLVLDTEEVTEVRKRGHDRRTNVFLKFSSFMNQLLSMLRATQGKST